MKVPGVERGSGNDADDGADKKKGKSEIIASSNDELPGQRDQLCVVIYIR